MSLLPQQILPETAPIGTVGPQGQVQIDHNWWLLLYNLCQQVLGIGGQPPANIIPLLDTLQQDALTAQSIGQQLYPITAAEIAASVTPANYGYPSGNVFRYGNIQTAINAAGGKGSVLIPGTYTGADTYNNPNNIPVIDLRSGQVGIWSILAPALNVTSGGVLFPEGNDLNLRVAGPADLYLEHLVLSTTTAVSLSIGANTNVLVGGFIVGNSSRGTVRSGTTALLATGAGLGLTIGRGLSNEEFVPNGNWSIVDGTHLNITCANTHSGNTTIEQLGTTVFATRTIVVGSYQTKTIEEGVNPPMEWVDANGVPYLMFTSDTTISGAKGGVQFVCPIYGGNGANGDLLLALGGASGVVRFKTSSGSQVGTLDGSGNLQLSAGIGVNGAPAPSQVTGWGTPTGASVQNNYSGSAATLPQTSAAVAEIITALKNVGIFAA